MRKGCSSMTRWAWRHPSQPVLLPLCLFGTRAPARCPHELRLRLVGPKPPNPSRRKHGVCRHQNRRALRRCRHLRLSQKPLRPWPSYQNHQLVRARRPRPPPPRNLWQFLHHPHPGLGLLRQRLSNLRCRGQSSRLLRKQSRLPRLKRSRSRGLRPPRCLLQRRGGLSWTPRLPSHRLGLPALIPCVSKFRWWFTARATPRVFAARPRIADLFTRKPGR